VGSATVDLSINDVLMGHLDLPQPDNVSLQARTADKGMENPDPEDSDIISAKNLLNSLRASFTYTYLYY